VQYYRKAKRQISQDEQTHASADHARQRFINRGERLRQEKYEQHSHKGKIATDQPQQTDKQAFIKDAVARTKAKRDRIRNQDGDGNSDG
jgi:Na+-translocating ferredoxin:NAD+ oxidoreductase RnfC subunit